MKECEVCGTQLKDDDSVCTNCADSKVEGEDVLSEQTDEKELALEELVEETQLSEDAVVAEVTEDSEVVAEAIEDGEVVAEAIEDGEVVAEAIEDGEVVAEAIEDSEVVAEAIEDGEVVAEAIEDSEVVAEAIEDSEVVAETTEDSDATEEAVDWTAPPDPYEDKQKRKRIAKMVGAAIVAIIFVVIGLFTWQKTAGTSVRAKKEAPIIYIDGEGTLKIHSRGMEDAAPIGNQGFTMDALFTPIITSDDNSMVAYITEAKSLFSLPVTSATTGVIDPKYLVEEAVEEVLAFAPDNNNLYYLGANNVLKMFDGKKSIEISKRIFVPSAQSQNMAVTSVISVLNNNRILYYTGAEKEKVLHTQISTKPKSQKEIGAAEMMMSINPEDKGVFFYELKGDGEAYAYFSNYYDFKSEAVFEYGDVNNLANILYLGVDGAMITMEAAQGELITEFSIDETEAPVQRFGIFYLKNGEKKSIVDNVINFQYAAVDGSFLVFTTEEGENINCWFLAIDKNGKSSEKHQFATLQSGQQIYATGLPDDKGIIVSVPGLDSNIFTATKFLRKNNVLSEGIVVDAAAELVLHNTVEGKLLIEKNISLLNGPEIEGVSSGSTYLADLYASDEKGQVLLGSGVELYSAGTANGSVQHDDKILFLKDCFFNEQGYAYGTLALYKAGVVKEVVKNFLLPSSQEGMAVAYVAEDMIYCFNFNIEAQTVEMVLYTGEGQVKVLDSNIVTLMTRF